MSVVSMTATMTTHFRRSTTPCVVAQRHLGVLGPHELRKITPRPAEGRSTSAARNESNVVRQQSLSGSRRDREPALGDTGIKGAQGEYKSKRGALRKRTRSPNGPNRRPERLQANLLVCAHGPGETCDRDFSSDHSVFSAT